MSYAIRILMHAITMVCRDPAATVRATYVGIALIAASVVGLLVAAPSNGPQLLTQQAEFTTGLSNPVLVIACFIIMAVGYLMMVAAWHRYVLLPEDKRAHGFTPDAAVVLGYFGRSILIGLLLMLLSLPVFVPVAALAAATNSVALSAIASIPAIAVLVYVFLRLSLILPACTIGHDMKIRESWEATKPLSAVIAILTVLMALADFAINVVLGALPNTSMIVGVVNVVVSLVYALVSASVLTTLYGIAVEGRDV